jgi:hypothetical protein
MECLAIMNSVRPTIFLTVDEINNNEYARGTTSYSATVSSDLSLITTYCKVLCMDSA